MIAKEKVQRIEQMVLDTIGEIETILADEPTQDTIKWIPYNERRNFESVFAERLYEMNGQLMDVWIHLGRLAKRIEDNG
jgi:hypothetical protein